MRTIYEFDVDGKIVRFDDVNKAREFEQKLKEKELHTQKLQKSKSELSQKLKDAANEVNKLMDQYEKETGEVAQVFQVSDLDRRIYIKTFENDVFNVFFSRRK